MKLQTDLLEKIKKTPRKNKTFLIGIDGFGGSGKSTLAKLLKEQLENVSIVEVDDFYLPSLGHADRKRILDQVILPLVREKSAKYQIFDWKKNRLTDWKTIQPGAVVIIDGISAMHQEFINYLDFRIWIECPQEVGFKRGVERDKVRDGVDTKEKWQNIWMPQEKEYVDSQNPAQYADYVINGV
ncbi:MAG TPA: AAA family ATPase [Candidatus Saccharimonadales bacterium]|nr:AAA family ATPase [Candidatus Saccharimonadales bacterium]